MRCPFCAHQDDRVVDSRTGKNGEIIRRRRECLSCQRRFTTYERVEEVLPVVVKKDDRREPFDHQKVLAGIRKACQKRPIGLEKIEQIVVEIENALMELGEREVSSERIGEFVIERLHAIDDVAYVRFASVYRQFKDISEFMNELKGLLDKKHLSRASGDARDAADPEK